jgi:hypothetical protein
MSGIEELGRDPDGRPSSQPPYARTGPNRGRRKRESGGGWVLVSGYSSDCGPDVQAAHGDWARAMRAIGIRIGALDGEGERNFYAWRAGA